jgi:hypothetical protein
MKRQEVEFGSLYDRPNVNMKQVSTAASRRCSGLHASPGPSKSFGVAERNGDTPAVKSVA